MRLFLSFSINWQKSANTFVKPNFRQHVRFHWSNLSILYQKTCSDCSQVKSVDVGWMNSSTKGVDYILDTIVKVVLINNRDWLWYKHSAEDRRSSVIWEGMRVSMGQKQHLESAHMCYGRINNKWIRILQRKIFIFFIMCSSFYHSFSCSASSSSSTSYSSFVTTLYCYHIYAITSIYHC